MTEKTNEDRPGTFAYDPSAQGGSVPGHIPITAQVIHRRTLLRGLAAVAVSRLFPRSKIRARIGHVAKPCGVTVGTLMMVLKQSWMSSEASTALCDCGRPFDGHVRWNYEDQTIELVTVKNVEVRLGGNLT